MEIEAIEEKIIQANKLETKLTGAKTFLENARNEMQGEEVFGHKEMEEYSRRIQALSDGEKRLSAYIGRLEEAEYKFHNEDGELDEYTCELWATQ